MIAPEIKIKRKILGVLMRNARQRAGLNIAETAVLLGIAPATLTDYETGAQEADLPVLEELAKICDVPVSYFWGDESLPTPDKSQNFAQAITLKRKIMGLLLTNSRTEMGYSQAELADLLGCSVDEVVDYEQGQAEIPFSRLQRASEVLNVSLDYYLNGGQGAESPDDAASRVAPPAVIVSENLSHLPEEVQVFISEPSNILYLKLAMRLHGLSTDTLRMLAEGILDITY